MFPKTTSSQNRKTIENRSLDESQLFPKSNQFSRIHHWLRWWKKVIPCPHNNIKTIPNKACAGLPLPLLLKTSPCTMLLPKQRGMGTDCEKAWLMVLAISLNAD